MYGITNALQVEPGVNVRVVTTAEDPNTAIYNGDHEVYGCCCCCCCLLLFRVFFIFLPVSQILIRLPQVSFTVVIPKSVVANGSAAPVLQYGHGLFGAQSEIDQSYLDDEANQYVHTSLSYPHRLSPFSSPSPSHSTFILSAFLEPQYYHY